MQGPRLYRFFNYEMPDYLPAPTAGWNPDAQPWEIPVSQAPQLDNFLIQPGKLVMRGPLVVTADLSTWYPLNLAGVGMTSTGALLGRKNASAAGQVDNWNAPLLLPASADLASGLTTGLWVVGGTVSTVTFASADTIPGPRWINYDGLLYGISYDSAGAAVQDASNSYYAKPTTLCTLAKAPPGGAPSNSPGTYGNNASSGSIAWTVGSPSSAAAPLLSAAINAPASGAVGSSGGGNNWGAGFPASVAFNSTQGLVTTNYLSAAGFGFSIPANAVIQGIAVTIGRCQTGSTLICADASLTISPNAGSLPVVGTDHHSGSNWPAGSYADAGYGSSSDLWGQSWTPAAINASTFGVLLAVNGRANSGTMDANVSHVTVTVYYYVPTATQYLGTNGYGFSLPNTATVQGIAVTVTHDATATASDAAILLVKGGTIQTTNRSTGAGIPGGMTAVTFGGSTDLWGTSWAYSDINASTFGAVYQATLTGGAVNVQSITIQVWWVNGTPVTLTALTNAPHGAFDLIGYQSRIWLLGGIDTPGSGTTHSPVTLFFTNSPLPAGGGSASTDWKDTVHNTTNQIVMDGDTSDYGVGLATVRNGLIVLRRASIYLLKGSTTANYALVPISRDMGCVDARSIVESDQGVYFVSNEGLMMTNGTTVINVSGSVLHTLRAAIAAEQKSVIAGKGGYVTCGRASHGQLIISVGIGAPTAGSYAPIFTAMYDPSAAKGGAWVRLTSQLWSNDGTQTGGNNYCGQIYDYKAPKRLLAFGDRYVTAIQDQSVGLSMLDYNAGLYDQLPSGANPYLAIPAVWKTVMPAITTAAKRTFGQAKRYYVDYQFSASNLTPSSAWKLQPVDGSANVLDTQTVPANAAPSLSGFVSGVTPVPAAVIERSNFDFWDEVGDIMFVVTWQDIARAQQAGSSVAELYGLGLEFQHSRERR